jgi:hypothetical protein
VKFGYWADLASLQLDDSGEAQRRWIQAMPLGKYNHPVYGEIEITPDKVQQFAQNVKDGVRNTELDIDYDHKAYNGEAAGWVKDAEARPDGLWILIEWTKKAAGLLKDKAYRYFSPEFADEWEHPKDGTKYKNVLNGGAITNRPFLKDILPINMSELFTSTGAPTAPSAPAPQPIPSEGGHMDPKKLREALGLQEDASDADVVAKLAEGLNPTPPAPTPPVAPPPTTLPTPTEPSSPADVAALLRQLSDVDGNPAIKALTDLVKAQQNQLAEVVQQRKVERIDRQLADLDAGKKFAVPPAVKDQLRDILLRSPEELGQQVLSAYTETLKLGVIDLGERGWQRRGDDKSPTQMYLTAIDEMMSKPGNKMSYAEATARVAAENPQLAAQYREESYIPSEGR